VVSEKIVWASGTGGTVIRTVDRGKTWNVIVVPGAEKLDFRDIEAFDAKTAYVLSIGNGDSSRIYKTTDGGATWNLQFKNDDPKKFFDAISCLSATTCIAMSDPVDGKFPLIHTKNGRDWTPVPILPSALEGEAAFAASGACLIWPDAAHAFIVTGGKAARVLRGIPDDQTNFVWPDSMPGIVAGSSGSGIFSIAMRDRSNGVIVGGNYEKPDEHEKDLAFTSDGGKTWILTEGLSGYRSGVTYVDKHTIIAVGTNGSDIARDGGKSWSVLGNENLNAVQSKGPGATWAVGPNGMVVKLK
jgi:photosystem II stability/assembly factor-like uncharacterized protein